MICKIIFGTAVALSILAVLLLSVLSPIPYKNNPELAFSFYIQRPKTRTLDYSTRVFTFHRTLTEGPLITSKIVGNAQGFVIPQSAFGIIYLRFDTNDYSGSLSIQAKQLENERRNELRVVGGTGSFAYASGFAVFEETRTGQGFPGGSVFQVRVRLTFPNRSQSTRV